MEEAAVIDAFPNIVLFTVVTSGFLSLLYRDLFVSVILLSIFSFLSALLFYIAHAPDVAITEAAVGAGMTTLIFVWAVRSTAGTYEEEPVAVVERSTLNGDRGRRRRIAVAAADILLALATGIVLFIALPPMDGGPVMLRDYIVENGYRETGAINLVSAVYLGYRAFDTFGETIVLLCAVSGSIFLLSREK